jgi:hypothetical protein
MPQRARHGIQLRQHLGRAHGELRHQCSGAERHESDLIQPGRELLQPDLPRSSAHGSRGVGSCFERGWSPEAIGSFACDFFLGKLSAELVQAPNEFYIHARGRNQQ